MNHIDSTSEPECFRQRAFRLVQRCALFLALGFSFTNLPAGGLLCAQSIVRHYRADAVVSVLSIPVCKKSGVGSGYAVLDQRDSVEGRRVRLRFAAGSWPEQAHGLNRLGYIEEEVFLAEGNDGTRADYLGFMTTSEEHSVSQARAALSKSPGEGQIPYSVMAGASTGGAYRTSKARIHCDARRSWADWEELLPIARQAVSSTTEAEVVRTREIHENGTALLPMLYTLFESMTRTELALDQRFVWGGEQFVLRVTKRVDARIGKRLAEKNLTEHPGRVLRLTGQVINPATGVHSRFRLWYEDGSSSPLPLRIEYRPRSYLSLLFEADGIEVHPSPGAVTAAKDTSRKVPEPGE